MKCIQSGCKYDNYEDYVKCHNCNKSNTWKNYEPRGTVTLEHETDTGISFSASYDSKQLLGKSKKIIQHKTYTITTTINEDDQMSLERVNDGFDIFELLGIIGLAKREIEDAIITNTKQPDLITKVCVKQEE